MGLVFAHFPHEWLPPVLYVYFQNVSCRRRTRGHKCCAASHARMRSGRPPGVQHAFPMRTAAPACAGGSLCLPGGPLGALEERSLPCAWGEAPGEKGSLTCTGMEFFSTGLRFPTRKEPAAARTWGCSIAAPLRVLRLVRCATYLGGHLALSLSAESWKFTEWIGKVSWIENLRLPASEAHLKSQWFLCPLLGWPKDFSLWAIFSGGRTSKS